MSKYTTEVRFICEHSAGLTESVGYSGVDEVIGKAIPKVFSFNFPIFDESYRDVLCRKILKHYYTREICEESVGLWKLRLDTRMNEIMPYYNKLYKSELLEFNPLYDTELTRTSNRNNESEGSEEYTSNKDATGNSVTDSTNSGTNKSTTNETSEGSVHNSEDTTTTLTSEGSVTGTSEGTTTGSNNSTTTVNGQNTGTDYDLYSDTPQGALTNVENEEYLTNARKKTTATNNNETTGIEGETNTTENSTTKTLSNNSGSSTTKGADDSVTTGKVDTVTEGETSGTGKTTTTSTGNDKFTSNQNRDARTTEEYLETVMGKQSSASYSKLLMEYRETFLNIDMQVINSLSDLFFGLW